MNIYQKSVFAALEEEGIRTIVNTVNTRGVMGAGLALEFRLRYPEYFDDYQKRCESDLPGAGDAWLYRGSSGTPDIVSLFVKEDWKRPSKPEWIRKAIEKLSKIILSESIERIALPLAGAGKGGVNPKISLSITEEALEMFHPKSISALTNCLLRLRSVCCQDFILWISPLSRNLGSPGPFQAESSNH